MHRAFWFNTDAGAHWSVINDDDYSDVELADRFLQYMRSGRVDNPQVRRGNRAVSPVLHGTIAGLVATGDHCFPYVVENRAVAAASAPGETGVVWTRASAGATMVG